MRATAPVLMQMPPRQVEPPDQARIPRPRLGYHGPIDDQLDYQLIDEVAHLRRDWHILLIGPCQGIDSETLPKAPNIHYLGEKDQSELGAYVHGWDVAMMPLVRRAGMSSINPILDECLERGVPVVCTLLDNVDMTGETVGRIETADGAEEFIDAALRAMSPSASVALGRLSLLG